ncbi:MAG: type VII secretion integral membrane protein EccD [Mycobacterium sp.]
MTEIAVLPPDLESTGAQAVSPVPELVRVAVVGRHRQIDLALPLDVPIALLVPEVVRLFDDAGSEDRPKDVAWVLVGAESGASLEPGGTLRDAGVAQDDVLRLRGRATLAAPTLYDDVVDAAARLNQSGHPGWDPAAARRIAYLGIALVAAAWVYLVLVDASSPRRAALLGLTAFATVTLLVVAAIFPRSGGAPQVGAALGWACLPVAAAGCWAGLSSYGSLALAGGALALILLCVAGYRLVGAGEAGFTAAGVFFACGAIALAIHAAGLDGFTAAVGLAVGATLATTTVPRLTARLDYSRPARPDAASPGDDVAPRVALARSLRVGLYAGFAVSACFGGTAVAWFGLPSWPALTFGVVCAAALGLPRPAAAPTGVVRAASGLPAVALVVAVALAAVRGDEPVTVTGASALLAGAVVLAVVGAGSGSARPRPRSRTLLALGSYLGYALVIPSAVWALGAHRGWGVG